MKCPNCGNNSYKYKIKLDRNASMKHTRTDTETICNKCKYEGNEPIMSVKFDQVKEKSNW